MEIFSKVLSEEQLCLSLVIWQMLASLMETMHTLGSVIAPKGHCLLYGERGKVAEEGFLVFIYRTTWKLGKSNTHHFQSLVSFLLHICKHTSLVEKCSQDGKSWGIFSGSCLPRQLGGLSVLGQRPLLDALHQYHSTRDVQLPFEHTCGYVLR